MAYALLRSKHDDEDENITLSDYVVLVIDPKLLPTDTRFYVDPNLQRAVFMYGNISPKCIIDIKKLCKKLKEFIKVQIK